MPDANDTTQTISDDQELAKVLAGVSAEADEPIVPTAAPLSPIEPPVVAEPEQEAPAPIETEPIVQPTSSDTSLDGIKKDAILELRPLVDKLQLAPEEKFDTYLLLLRSTDDKELIAPAHEAAKTIEDESRRAQALLDIIKEIDFLNQQTAA